MNPTRRKRLNKKRQARKRRRRLLTLMMALIVISGSLLSYFYFQQHSSQLPVVKPEGTILKAGASEIINSSSQANQGLQKQTTNQIEEAQRFKPRMNLDPKSIDPKFQSLSRQIDQQINDSGFIGSILVVKNNQLVLEKGYGYANKKENKLNTHTSEFMIASLQKQFTALLIMKLVEQDLLTLDTPVAEFYPDLPNAKTLTIRDLLSMTSGYYSKGTDESVQDEQAALDYTLANLTYEAPTKWRYSSTNYVLLAGIIRRLSKQSYQDFFQQEIIDKLGLTHTGFYTDYSQRPDQAVSYRAVDYSSPYKKAITISHERYAIELGTGNVYSSVADLLTVYQGIIDKKIVPPELLQDMWTQAPTMYNYSYTAGLYHKENFIRSHGLFNGYEPTVVFSYDGSTAVITLANYYLPDSYNVALTDSIFQQLQE